MKKVWLGILLSMAVLVSRYGYAAEEEKPLSPGWLSLDCCIGLYVDNNIAKGKSSLENVLGISIGGYIDTEYNWASSHPQSFTQRSSYSGESTTA